MSARAALIAALIAAVLASFAARMAAELRGACLATIDLYYLLAGSLGPGWRFGAAVPVFRGGLGAEIAAAAPWAGFSAARWGLVLLAVHAVNAGLVFAFARRAGLARAWAAGAALLFCAVPGLADSAFRPSNATELLLLTAFLLVTVAYMGRAEAESLGAKAGWLLVEAGAVVLGVGNKESFVVYPALLAAYELTLGRDLPRDAHPRAAAARLAPHLPLFAYAAAASLPWIVDSPTHAFALDFSPASLLRQAARISSAVAMPWFENHDPLSPPWAALLAPAALALLAKRGGPAARFAALFALVVAAPVLVLGRRFDAVYAYHVWPAFATAAALALSSAGPGPTAALGAWLALLAVLPGTRMAKACAFSADAAAAVETLPCGSGAPRWAVPRGLAAEHLALWRAAAARISHVPVEARRCLEHEGLDEGWRCAGGDLAEDALLREESAPVPVLRQLLAARCGRLGVRLRLARNLSK